MNPDISDLLVDLLSFAGNHAPINAESNEDRVLQLLDWVDGLTETPWGEGEETHVSFSDAKSASASIREILQASAEQGN